MKLVSLKGAPFSPVWIAVPYQMKDSVQLLRSYWLLNPVLEGAKQIRRFFESKQANISVQSDLGVPIHRMTWSGFLYSTRA
jgi:hypothetical protein